MTAWEQVAAGLDHGGYSAWEAEILAAEGAQGRDHVPVFFELRAVAGGPSSLLQAIDATLALPDLRFSRHERDLLATERAMAQGEGWPHKVRAVAFVLRAALSRLPVWLQVLNLGPALALQMSEDCALGQDLLTTKGDLDPDVPVVAVIDDGIGFLNARFRSGPQHSRIRAAWLQAPERAVGGGAVGDVLCGSVLTQADIDAHLLAGGEEATIYRQVNRALFPLTDSTLTNRRAAHGTHVLDLAAGADPWGHDPLKAVPILAVQLPPASVRETAGRRMESYLLQGLRWILAEALRQAQHSEMPPVVINLSLGSLAGPGDRHAFLADWFAYEIARHARITGGADVRLVIAYGNARLSRLVARAELRRSQPMDLVWRVQPDDHSSSFLELRVDAGMAPGLKLRLTPPQGSGLPGLDVDWPSAGTGWKLPGPLAMVAGLAEPGGQAVAHLSLGPTAGLGPLPASPSGAWTVSVLTTVAEPVRITARVQRDDTPEGYRTLGRQSWLDHPRGWDWDDDLRGYLAPRPASDAPGCPVTRQGSWVAYAGADDPRILFVGAARPATGQPGTAKPAFYSAEGVRHLARPGESRGPSLVALGDDGTALPGRRAAGVLSGSVARMAGTSMAAPQVARQLACYFLQTPAADRSLDAERAFLTGNADWDQPDPRMGNGVLRA